MELQKTPVYSGVCMRTTVEKASDILASFWKQSDLTTLKGPQGQQTKLWERLLCAIIKSKQYQKNSKSRVSELKSTTRPSNLPPGRWGIFTQFYKWGNRKMLPLAFKEAGERRRSKTEVQVMRLVSTPAMASCLSPVGWGHRLCSRDDLGATNEVNADICPAQARSWVLC